MVINNLGEPVEPDYYAQLVAGDIIDMMGEQVKNGVYKIQSDGKMKAEQGFGSETPWHHVRLHEGFDCDLWHTVTFDIIGTKYPKFVPEGCQRCYKVVVRPRTLKELFMLLDIQMKLDVPSKCGIERRPTVHGLYGGYFYNDGIKAGLEKYTQVRNIVSEAISPDVKVILKRACTEFEMAFPDSSTWTVTPWQRQVEALVKEWITNDIPPILQPPTVLTHVHRRWIEWAYQNGDETYLEYTGGKPLYPRYTTYEHLVGKTDEEIAAFTKVNPK